VVEGNPMRVSLYLEKISKRLKGTNPYRCTYLENSQRAKRIDSCQHLSLENFIRGGEEPKEGSVIALKRPSYFIYLRIIAFFKSLRHVAFLAMT
jgi:hypothetical protein